MQGKPNKLFWWVFGVHAAVIGGLLTAPLFHRRPKEIVHFVEFVSEPAPEQPVEIPVPVEEPIIKKEVVNLPTPTNRVQKVEKPKWKPAKVVRQDKRVTKEPQKPVPVTPAPKRITPTDIQNALGSGGGTVSPFAAYYTAVRERMYAVWQVPVGAAYGLSARASITVGTDGAVSNSQLIRPSGNSAFDQSVQSALNTVNRLPRPPVDLPSRTITIEFAPQ